MRYQISQLRAHRCHRRPPSFLQIVRNIRTQCVQEPFKVLFFGRDEFSCIVFEELYSARDVWEGIWIATHPDMKSGRRGEQLSVSQLKTLGESVPIPVHTIPSEKSMFKYWKPPPPFMALSTPPLNHILITASFGRILSAPLLRNFDPARRLNVHPSLLPAYRGAAPIQHTLLNGETDTGVCVIEMMERTKGIDSGAIWGSKKLSIPDGMSFPYLRDILAREGGKLLVSVLRDLLAGRATSTPQLHTDKLYAAPLITSTDSIIDPRTMTAEDIVRRHRAISHQRPLITYLPTGKTLQLHSPAVYDIRHASTVDIIQSLTPGTAMYHPATHALLICCASPKSSSPSTPFVPVSILSVPYIKQEGRALLVAKEWWNGIKGTMGIVENGTVRLSSSHDSVQDVGSPKRRRASLQEIINPQPTAQEIWKWTLTSEAIAPCFVRDIFAMRDNAHKDAEFFWLGRVPCRSVRIVGLVVGVQVYEKRILYSVDDGTSVIDCLHRQSQASSVKRGDTFKAQSTREFPRPPKPIANVGSLVCIVGRVTKWHDSRQLYINHIERCASTNDEPIHWRTVRALHKTSYALPDPFVIPPLPSIRESTSSEIRPNVTEPQTPSSMSVGMSSPISSRASSPAKSDAMRSPARLRHPSRLHSRDLTANTFRIYIKHYMDNAPTQPEPDSTSWLVLTGSTPLSRSSGIPHSASVTPTKPSRFSNNQTPKQTKFGANACDWTPRPIPAPVFVLGQDKSCHRKAQSPTLVEEDDTTPITLGFTLSYLRRVPELVDMAKRVVKAEAKRRAREDKKRLKEQSQKGGFSKDDPEPRNKEPLDKDLHIRPKMKRLFEWAIVKLYEEGSIVIWDGPVRLCSDIGCNGTSGLWKANSSANSNYPDSTVFSSVTGLSRIDDDDDAGELSDPQPDEEAYVSLSSAYLAKHVEKAIGTLMARCSTVSGNAPASGRTVTNGAPPPGPTKEQITSFLRRLDGRWERVGVWAVDEALEVLRIEGKVWSVGGGRWELCR